MDNPGSCYFSEIYRRQQTPDYRWTTSKRSTSTTTHHLTMTKLFIALIALSTLAIHEVAMEPPCTHAGCVPVQSH